MLNLLLVAAFASSSVIGLDANSYGYGSSAKKANDGNYEDYGRTWGLGGALSPLT